MDKQKDTFRVVNSATFDKNGRAVSPEVQGLGELEKEKKKEKEKRREERKLKQREAHIKKRKKLDTLEKFSSNRTKQRYKNSRGRKNWSYREESGIE